VTNKTMQHWVVTLFSLSIAIITTRQEAYQANVRCFISLQLMEGLNNVSMR